MEIRKLIFVFSCLLSVAVCQAEISTADDGPLYTTTGPVPPTGVAPKVREEAAEAAGELKTILVPGYEWRHGCAPTAVGMVVGYYDTMGYELIGGDASTQTKAVNQAIASQGNASNPRHYEDYSLPIDDPDTGLLADNSVVYPAETHTNDCIGDFMRTSWYTLGLYYGDSSAGRIGGAFTSYVNLQNSNYGPDYKEYRMWDGTLNWDVLTNEIDNGRPMAFLVDVTGYGAYHLVTVVGYSEVTHEYGCLDTWAPADVIRWCDFRQMAEGVPWGVWEGWSFHLVQLLAEINIKQNETDIPNETGIYNFGPVELGQSKSVTFTIENFGVNELELTGSGPVIISGVNAGEFVVSRQPSTPITGGGAATFEITFSPAGEGRRSARASIANNDADENPYTFSLAGSTTGGGAIVYVDADATGANNGLSWADAYTCLRDVLTAASSGDEIWVAEGIYKPTGTGERTATFQLKNGVALYGGFAGVEMSLDEREPNRHVTILSGDLNGDDGPNFANNGENSYHVVRGSGTDETAVLDGFTITGGNANQDYPSEYANGGGMYNNHGSATVANCTFSGNSAMWGGGMCNGDYGSPMVTNCTFSRNRSEWWGGGMCNYDYSSPTLTNCTFIGNRGNRCSGGMDNSGYCTVTLTNCTFSGNSADYGGGMSNWYYSNAILTNCTFSGNSANHGGGIDNWEYSSATLTSCILWGDRPAEIYVHSSTVEITYSDVEGGWPGKGNIDADPCFVEPGYWDVNGVWVEGDYHLPASSPCINAGDPNYTGEPNETDADGKARVIGGRIDMGAYEATIETKANLWVSPKVINRYSKMPKILALVRLPEDVTRDEVDSNEPLLLYPGGIEALNQYVIQHRRGEAGGMNIFAFFNKASLMDAVGDDGGVELQVVGRLKVGRYFYGTDTVRIIGHKDDD
ncbi:MAG: choice-of-anchor D domain-containing protein [Planctomycetota bacterium]|jgi:hypothetical protein